MEARIFYFAFAFLVWMMPDLPVCDFIPEWVQEQNMNKHSFVPLPSYLLLLPFALFRLTYLNTKNVPKISFCKNYSWKKSVAGNKRSLCIIYVSLRVASFQNRYHFCVLSIVSFCLLHYCNNKLMHKKFQYRFTKFINENGSCRLHSSV